jgi:hypothetical protein
MIEKIYKNKRMAMLKHQKRNVWKLRSGRRGKVNLNELAVEWKGKIGTIICEGGNLYE